MYVSLSLPGRIFPKDSGPLLSHAHNVSFCMVVRKKTTGIIIVLTSVIKFMSQGRDDLVEKINEYLSIRFFYCSLKFQRDFLCKYSGEKIFTVKITFLIIMSRLHVSLNTHTINNYVWLRA